MYKEENKRTKKMKLIVFDIDGTLSNTGIIDDICFFGTFDSLYNIEIDRERWGFYKVVAENTDLGLYRYIHTELFSRRPNLSETQHFKECFFRLLKSSYAEYPLLFREIPGAKEFVELIHRKEGYCLAFATGCWSESAEIKLTAIGLGNLNIPISCSDALESRTKIVSNACVLAEEFYQSSGFEEIFYFGDGLWDYQAAQALNLKFVGVDFEQKHTFFDAKPHLVINDYSDIENILNQL